MERRHWWWNGRFGHLARHDVVIHEHDGRWLLEDRTGGVEGRSRWAEAPTEKIAMTWADTLTAETDGWRSMPC